MTEWTVKPRDQVETWIRVLKEIASYNAEELREWEEDNAADMVNLARQALAETGLRGP